VWDDLLDPAPRTAAPVAYAEAERRLHAAADAVGAERVPIGASREGRTLELVRIGAGPRRVLWYAGPHANEVAGVATLVTLAERLARHAPLLDGGTGIDVLLCIDPDAYVRNEAWFAPEIDMAAYYRHFHRPPMDEWPDWDFPVTHGSLQRSSHLPETAALRSAIELSRPALMVSLHNGELHGMHGYIAGDAPGLADALAALPARFGFPVELVALDDPTAVPLAAGIFAAPVMTEAWDAVLASGAPDPAALLPMGDSAAAWALQRYGTVTVISEVPHWSMRSALPTDGTIGDLAFRTASTVAGFGERLAAALAAVDLPTADLRVRSCRNAVPMLARLAAGFRALAEGAAGTTPASSADQARLAVMLGECLPQRYRGQLLGAMVDARAPEAVVRAAQQDFDEGIDRLRALPIRAHPFASMVEAQLATGLVAIEQTALPA
jgi:hypothetical protein